MDHEDSEKLLKAIDELNSGNHAAAVMLLGPLADGDNLRAKCYLAHAYHLGLGVEMDGRKAVELYLSVAERNIQEGRLSALAYNNLATIYLTGAPGVQRDVEKGQRYLTRSRELGFEM
jgi:TPR repeat protein